MKPEEFMQAAIAEAKKSGTPYGAVIVKDGKIVERSGNTVEPDNDPTAHAEINAIRKLTSRLNKPSVDGDYTLYSTCEPCAMCAATCFWTGISTIVYGVGNDDFSSGENPNLIDIRCEEVFKRSPNNNINIQGGILMEECRALHPQ